MGEEWEGGGWRWGEWLLALLVGLVLLPVLPHPKVRYYACYAHYTLVVSAMSLLLAPYFALRARDITNLNLAATLLKNFTKILGIKWELRNGEELKQERGAVIAANHQTILDIMGMFNIWAAMGRCTAVGKKELLYVVPFGPVAWLAGLIFIDRNVPKLANAQLHKACTRIRNLKAKLWMFPEGTRNKQPEKLLPFKNGAFRIAIESQVPIIPVVYSPYYFIDSKNKTFDEGKVIISVLEAIPTEGMTLKDLDKLREKTFSVMSDEFERLKKEISIYQNK